MENNFYKFIEEYPSYIAQKGEEYMSKKMLIHFEQKLLAWKKQILADIDTTVRHLKNDTVLAADTSDRATQEEEFAVELRTRNREGKLLKKIEQSLILIKNGTYGYCQESGEEIGITRMEARPTATLTVDMKKKKEQQERQGLKN